MHLLLNADTNGMRDMIYENHIQHIVKVNLFDTFIIFLCLRSHLISRGCCSALKRLNFKIMKLIIIWNSAQT